MSDEMIEEELVDSFDVTIEEETTESGEKKIGFRSLLSKADKLNGNRRIYPKAVLRSVYTEALERSKKSGKPIFGELEHAKDAHINLERIAVTFPEFTWDEETGEIRGKAVPTLTEAGETVRKLALSGFPICFSTRMAGKVRPLTEAEKAKYGVIGEEKCSIVCENARLVSIDVVGDPSERGAVSNTVYEEKQPEEPKQKLPTFKQVFDAMF